ncbi:MAG: hypothetical protein WD335_01405 [Candidatus Paceibacterota bacterium]
MNSIIKISQPVIFFLLLTVVFALTGLATSASAHEGEAENKVIIHMDQDGFDPQKITIQPGTEVIFENVGDDGHWPATNDHPSHTLYDDTDIGEHCTDDASAVFDACKAIPAGESWSFVFEKEGSFGYHNHLWPHLVGEVTVQEVAAGETKKRGFFSFIMDSYRNFYYRIINIFSSPNEEVLLNTGSTDSNFYKDLKNRYEAIVMEQDPREAIQALREASAENERTSALCHDILHEVGHTAFDKYGSFDEAIAFQSDFCNSGYIHGLFESYFQTTAEPLSGLAAQCNRYAEVGGRPFDLWQCQHGAGHGFMYLTGGDLDESLKLCEEGFRPSGAGSCRNGVYMEVFNLEILAKEPDFVDKDDPFRTCSQRDTGKSDCYLYMPTYLSQTGGMELTDVFDACKEAELGYESTCIHGVGSEAIKRNMNNIDTVFSLCRQAGSFSNQERCVAGVAGMYMNQSGSFAAGKEICSQAPKRFREVCDRTVENRASFFGE